MIQRGVRASQSKISEEQLLEIITLLKENKISDRDIAKKYNICFNAISEMNHGISYRIEGLQYPIRKFSQSKKRAFSIEEVKKFREEYEKDGLHPKEIYNRNKIKVSYNAFKAMLKRQTYKEIN